MSSPTAHPGKWPVVRQAACLPGRTVAELGMERGAYSNRRHEPAGGAGCDKARQGARAAARDEVTG